MLEIGIRDLWFPFRGEVDKGKQEEVLNKWSKDVLHRPGVTMEGLSS